MKAQTVLASIAVFLAMATVSAKEGFYSVTRDADGIWWGVRPDGAKFVPNGVAHVNLDAGNPNAREVKSAYGQACLGKYGSSAAWTTNALARLRDWGFNIVCCDSDYDRLFKEGPAEAMGFGYAYGLYTHRPLQRGARRKDPNFCITPQDGITCGLYFPNVFHPDYERITDEYCAETCGKRKDDRALFGYFISNELAWGGRAGDMKSGEGLFDYVNEKLDSSHPARQALERIVAACGGDRTSPATKEKFLEAVAERYFSVNAAAIRRHDPNHLVLGCRFAGLVHPAVIRIAGKYCDVVTLNFYSWSDIARNEVRAGRFGRPVASLWKETYDLAGKPLMITEWSFPSLDRGHRSTRGAGMRVRTQRERVAASELYLRTCLSLPFVLGTSWFRHADKPMTSVAGGEDCAYGLVDERDEPYPELTAMFRRVHAEEKALRRAPTPKANPDADDGSMDAAAFRAKNRWGEGKLKFTQNGNAYRLENERGGFFEGRVGNGPLGFVGVGGTNVVKLVACMRISEPGRARSEWANVGQVEGFSWNENERALRLTVCNRKTGVLGMSFRMDVKVTMDAGGKGVLAEILDIENTGDKRFEVVSAYLRPYPCWKATKEGAHYAGGSVYGGLAEATWDQPGEDRVCRCYTLSRNVQGIQFTFHKGSDYPHPDAVFVPDGGNVLLEPGKKHVFAESMYLVLEPGLKGAARNPGREVILADSFTMLNIVPSMPGQEEVAAADAIEFAERTGNPYCLYCLTLHPQGKPASKTVDAGVASYRKWAKLLEGSAVRPAILLQAIVGHWTRDFAEKDREPWQRAINIKGVVTRYCPLDPDYQAYIRDTARKLAECRPAVILSDDDVRAFSPLAECTCPLHTAEYNRRTGLSLTPDGLRSLIAKADWRSREHQAFAEMQRDTVTTVCRLLREGIDSVDPSIPSGVCEPGWAWAQRYIPETARAMAGTNHTAFARLANGEYFEHAAKSGVGSVTMRTMASAERLRNSGLLLLDEADTWPHNAWSKSAAAFHAKLAVSAFIGLKGAKLWYVNTHKGRYPVNRHYTDVLERHRGFYPAISAVARGTSPEGVLVPCAREFPDFSVAASGSGYTFDPGGWVQNVFSWYGIPYRATEVFDRDGIYAISGEKFISRLGDDDIRAMLSRRAIIEGGAAKALLGRGFGELMGVELVEGEPLFTGDYSEVRDDFMPFPKSTRPVLFRALPGAKTLSSFIWRESSLVKEFDRVAASGVVFTNRLGGTVVTTSLTPGLSGAYRCSEARQMYVNDLLDAAGGKAFENSCMNAQNVQALVRRAPDGTEYLLVENLNYDSENVVHVRRSARPAKVEVLSDHGQWKPANSSYDNGVLHVPCDWPCYEVKVFRFIP